MKTFIRLFSIFSSLFMLVLLIAGIGEIIFNIKVFGIIFSGAINGLTSTIEGLDMGIGYVTSAFKILDLFIWPVLLTYITIKMFKKHRITTRKKQRAQQRSVEGNTRYD